VDFHFFNRRGRIIFGGVHGCMQHKCGSCKCSHQQVLWVLSHKIGGVKRNFGVAKHFIGGVREISGGV
jgi:hypothetical protein